MFFNEIAGRKWCPWSIFENWDCYYCLPYIYQSKCPTILHLTDCELNKDVLCGEGIISSLRELKLEGSEEKLSKFISKRPDIRELSLVNCWGISFIVLTKLDHLKKLYVNVGGDFSSFTNIQVIVPSLQVLHFVSRSCESKKVAFNMDIHACKMLREFHLDCLEISPWPWSWKFLFRFSPSWNFITWALSDIERIKILSSSLRKWTLSSHRYMNVI